jgi:hypothetical protein
MLKALRLFIEGEIRNMTQSILTTEWVNTLNSSPLIGLITVNPDTLESQINAISWVRANKRAQRLRIAVGHQSECVENLQKGSPFALGLIDQKGYHMLRGKATISELKKATIKYYVIECVIEEIKDVMFYGGVISQAPTYIKTYDQTLADKIDSEIYQALEEGWN